jgi:hypothetical protein
MKNWTLNSRTWETWETWSTWRNWKWKLMKLWNLRTQEIEKKEWNVGELFLPMRCFQMCIPGSLLAICCHWKKVKCKQFKKKSNIAQMRTQNNFVWKIINVKIKHKRNANKRKNIFFKKNTRRKLVKTKRTKNIKQKHNQWHKN